MADFLTPKQYADITGVPLRTVHRWLREGNLPHLPKPRGVRQYRIPRTALNAVCAASTGATQAENVLRFAQKRA